MLIVEATIVPIRPGGMFIFCETALFLLDWGGMFIFYATAAVIMEDDFSRSWSLRKKLIICDLMKQLLKTQGRIT